MTIGIYTFELHLPQARSLKNKRQVVKRVKDRLRSRFNVAITELDDHADRWQRAGLAVVSVASNRDVLQRLFETIQRETEQLIPGHLVSTGTEFIEASDGGNAGWSADWE